MLCDLGSGWGAWGNHVSSFRRTSKVYKIGVDLFSPYFKVARSIYDEVVQADIAHPPFKDKSFDFVLSAYVLEHLSKEDGYEFLRQAERICKEVFICITENRYKPASISVPKEALAENPWLNHLSGWTPSELMRLGFKVRGISSLLFRYTRYPLNLIFFPLSPFAYLFPNVADKLIAWKSPRNLDR